MIEYQVSIASIGNRLLQVKLIINQACAHATLKFPTWIPGSYLQRDFSKHIVSIKASAQVNKKDIPCEFVKKDNHTWTISSDQVATFIIEYQVYAFDFSVRGAYLDNQYGFFTGPNLFFEVEEFKDCPHHVHIEPPKDKQHKHWRLATTMPRCKGGEWQFGHFKVDNYHALIDFPILFGEFEQYRFKVNAIPHDVIIVGKHRGDIERLCHDVERICASQYKIFGAFPFEQYMFMLVVTEQDYGGLEHRDSTMLMCSRKNMPIPYSKANRKDYITLLGLFSHEYFHSWNIKRIRPTEFIEYDLSKRVPTKLLWAFEGFTSYFDDLALMRSGVITKEEYLTQLCGICSLVKRSRGGQVQSLTESSFDAWTKFYQQDENAQNAIVSYYTKGSLAAFCFDIHLRCQSNPPSSLDTIMQSLWTQYGEPERGVDETTIQAMLLQVGGDTIKDLIQEALAGTTELPVEKYFAMLGLRLEYTETNDYSYFGDYKSSKPELSEPAVSLGIKMKQGAVGISITNVWQDSAAALAELWAGDEIIAIDSIQVSLSNIKEVLSQYQPGNTVCIHYFRRGLLRQSTLTLLAPALHTAMLYDSDERSEQQQQNLEAWLAGAA